MSIEEREQYMIDINDYQIVKQINKGGFGLIYLVKNNNTDKELVIKVNLIDLSSSQSVSMQQMVYRELSVLMRAQHPTIIQFRVFSPIDFNKNENMVIFMDYMKNSSLEFLLSQSQKGLCDSIFNNTIRQIILAGIVRGMMYLHSQKIIHRDLKPGNVLLDDNFYPHITDFGLSKFFDPQNTKNQSKIGCGTTVYMAPEVIQDDSYNTKVDVYAFAVIIYEVISGQPEFPKYIKGEMNEYQVKTAVISGKRPTFENVPIKSSFKRLIEKCWSENPSERPEFSELFEKLSTYKETQPVSQKIDEFSEKDDDNCLEDVDSEIFLDYIDSITQEDKKSEIHEDKNVIMNMLKKQEETINLMENHISSLENEIASLKKKNELFESKFNNSRIKIDSSYARCFGKSYVTTLNLKDQGFFAYLKTQEKNKIDRLFFFSSQSSNDIYNIVDQNSTDIYCSGSNGCFYAEFQLKEEISIIGIKIKSSIFCFPKSFDILINNETVVSTKHADGLNCANKEFTFAIPSKRGKAIRIKQTGGNWYKEGQEQNFFSLKKFELYSSDVKYKSKGVFEKMIEESPN